MMSLSPAKRAAPSNDEPIDVEREHVRRKTDNPTCRFFPTLTTAEHFKSLTHTQKIQLAGRASRLQKRAHRNDLSQSSEFCWEAHAWEDVFGLIQDDKLLRMDKYPCYVMNPGTDKDYKDFFCGKRIPDATFGLRARPSGGGVMDAGVLNMVTLRTKIQLEGNVAHGRRSPMNDICPFAVYEAKKVRGSALGAEKQVAQACDRYLGLLNSVLRDPKDRTKYQWPSSREYQIFSFTSCGPKWTVFIARRYGELHSMEQIWEGDVRLKEDATQLLCIVDQIHKWATDIYRPFVVRHLEVHSEA
ncbi:hypothetical protein GGR53DRAFT_461621 [Hypoxylon sp. FL1150]|nr:hypothetical protein GGR53DRAFT_461621 [Hypoxylon sp. FL1150]